MSPFCTVAVCGCAQGTCMHDVGVSAAPFLAAASERCWTGRERRADVHDACASPPRAACSLTPHPTHPPNTPRTHRRR
jgi:hypothetical protein